jgi:hypothetical protein
MPDLTTQNVSAAILCCPLLLQHYCSLLTRYISSFHLPMILRAYDLTAAALPRRGLNKLAHAAQ